MQRAKRTEPRRHASVSLTRRDFAVLRSVNRFRISTSHHLMAVCFPGIRADTAAKRLRKLVDGRYVAVRTLHPSAPNLYTLGMEGRRWRSFWRRGRARISLNP